MFKWLKNLFKKQEANAERVDAFVVGWEIHTVDLDELQERTGYKKFCKKLKTQKKKAKK